jgi:flagellar biogenesis protein FliO
MPWTFWASYLLKLGIVGLMLAATYCAAVALRRLPFFAARADRRIRIVESAALSQHAAVYLVRVGARCFLVGTAGTSIATLGELAAAELPPADVTR